MSSPTLCLYVSLSICQRSHTHTPVWFLFLAWLIAALLSWWWVGGAVQPRHGSPRTCLLAAHAALHTAGTTAGDPGLYTFATILAAGMAYGFLPYATSNYSLCLFLVRWWWVEQ